MTRAVEQKTEGQQMLWVTISTCLFRSNLFGDICNNGMKFLTLPVYSSDRWSRSIEFPGHWTRTLNFLLTSLWKLKISCGNIFFLLSVAITRHNMWKRKWLVSPMCFVCNQVETDEHLFFHYYGQGWFWGPRTDLRQRYFSKYSVASSGLVSSFYHMEMSISW